MKLQGRVAIVTGAGRGIGRSIARTLAAEGSSVALAARTEREILEVRTEIEAAGGTALCVRTDVSREDDVAHLFDEVLKRFGRLDILVNNAGIGFFAPLRELTLEQFERMWRVNVVGTFLCSQRGARMMEERGEGTIVNISSLAGKNAFTGGSGYAATKWALMGLSNCLRLEVRHANVRVITVCPGSVQTDFSPHADDPAKEGRILVPQDVADAVLHAVTAPARAMVSEIDIRPTNPR